VQLVHLGMQAASADARTGRNWREHGIINPSLPNTSSLNVDQLLMLHEMLHEVYGLDDKDIMNTLK